MKIDIKCELPFSWCQLCQRRDLTEERLIANGEVYESTTICKNAPICEACERARAADLQPAAKGKLVNPYMEEYYGQWYHCSVCGAEGLGPDDNFCPACGADLREEANNGN